MNFEKFIRTPFFIRTPMVAASILITNEFIKVKEFRTCGFHQLRALVCFSLIIAAA